MDHSKEPDSPAPEPQGARWGAQDLPRRQAPEAKRLAILRAAAQLFNENGFHDTSLNDLARSLNVTKPSLYYYVQSKDDILLQILNQAMGEIGPAIEAAQAASHGLEMLRIFVGRYVQILVGDFGKCLVLSGTSPLEPKSREQLAPAFRRIDQAVRQMIAKGIADGSIRPCDPKVSGFTLFGALHWMCSWYREDGLSPQELGDQIFDVFEKGLSAA